MVFVNAVTLIFDLGRLQKYKSGFGPIVNAEIHYICNVHNTELVYILSDVFITHVVPAGLMIGQRKQLQAHNNHCRSMLYSHS